MEEALLTREHWLYVVLTFDQSKITTPRFAYEIAGKAWGKLKKRLERKFGKFFYIQSWEETEAGFPHANLLLTGTISENMTPETLASIESWLKQTAPQCGFGYQIWIEPVMDRGATASYIVKVDQAPMHSPRGFRRVRPSRGLLKPTFAQLNRKKKQLTDDIDQNGPPTHNPAA